MKYKRKLLRTGEPLNASIPEVKENAAANLHACPVPMGRDEWPLKIQNCFLSDDSFVHFEEG